MSSCQACQHPTCVAAVRDDDGREICIFCDDGIPCPVLQRVMVKAKAPDAIAAGVAVAAAIARRPNLAPPTAEEKIAVAASLLQQKRAGRVITSTEEDAMAQIRMCAQQGCDKKLANNNTTGRCQLHGGGARRATPAQHGTCSTPGCSERLAANNKSGKCALHGGIEGDAQRVHSRPAAAATKPPDGAPAAVHHAPASNHSTSTTPANGGNGHANGHDALLEQRVHLVLEQIPLQEKLAFLKSWLAGEA